MFAAKNFFLTIAVGAPPSVEYLVVAGGGGGGGSSGGPAGGGAGGFRTATGFAVTAGTPLTVTIGAGGAGGSASVGTVGAASVFSSITSAGGGSAMERVARQVRLGKGMRVEMDLVIQVYQPAVVVVGQAKPEMLAATA
jgi:hypothetical protein